MDGKEALERLYDLVNEDSTSNFITRKLAFSYLNEAAHEFVQRTDCLKATQTITTVVDQAGYSLNADFLKLYLMDDRNRYYIKYNETFIYAKDYSDIVFASRDSGIPDRFAIIDDPTLDSRITGTTTSDGTATNGESVLTDTGETFTDVSAGDCVHNLTDESDGYVLTAGTTPTTALFNGTDNEWDSGDSYVIQPQGRLQLVLDPAPNEVKTVTVQYTQRPAPVYSNFTAFRFQPQQLAAIIKYAAWLIKYKDSDPNMGDAWYQFFEQQTRKQAGNLNNAFLRKGFRLNLKKYGQTRY